MKSLQEYDAKVCLTAAGALFHQGKVLLVKHKALQIWLAPGGHLEPHELPHQAAEREFWEETGIKVRAVQHKILVGTKDFEYVPNPVLSNLHWMYKGNYDLRKAGKKPTFGSRGCEQHVCFIYLVEAVGSMEFTQNIEETDGIGWFTPSEVQSLETTEDIKFEVGYCAKLVAPSDSVAEGL